MIKIYLLLALFVLPLQISALHQTGVDRSTSSSPLIGPEIRNVRIEFPVQFSQGTIPQVLISFSKYHFSLVPVNNYTTSAVNITHTGFNIIYETSTKKMEFSAEMQWLAFDESSDYFGEVIIVEEHITDVLSSFRTTGDEHRLEAKKIKLNRKYHSPPGIAIYVLGAANSGIERLIAGNYTNIDTESIDFITLAWHHTELLYYKFAIITFYPEKCHMKTGRKYIWSETDHSFSGHIWAQLQPESEELNFRHERFSVDLSHPTLKQFRPDFQYTGFIGYDVKNYLPNWAEFNLEVKNIEIHPNQGTVDMDVGVWQKTQLAGAWWNVLACETDGHFFDEKKPESWNKVSIFVTVSLLILTLLSVKLFSKSKSKTLLKEGQK